MYPPFWMLNIYVLPHRHLIGTQIGTYLITQLLFLDTFCSWIGFFKICYFLQKLAIFYFSGHKNIRSLAFSHDELAMFRKNLIEQRCFLGVFFGAYCFSTTGKAVQAIVRFRMPLKRCILISQQSALLSIHVTIHVSQPLVLFCNCIFWFRIYVETVVCSRTTFDR